jgi:hypothetical protein
MLEFLVLRPARDEEYAKRHARSFVLILNLSKDAAQRWAMV